jgi:hypothetical protein
MKRKVMTTAFVVAIAIVSGINVFNAQKTEVLSDVALANVEALADDENRKPCEDVCFYYEGWKCTRIINGVSSVCEPYRLK